MSRVSFDFCKTIADELNPERLQRKFLMALLDLQNVERGSIWVRRDDGYYCIEAAGSQSEQVKGITISADHPSIVGWVIENGKVTMAEPGKDDRHFREAEKDLEVKSKLILCFPLLLRSGVVYGAVQIIDTSAGGNRLNLNKDYLELLQDLIDIGSIALGNSLVYTDQVKENQLLKRTLDAIRTDEMIIGQSPTFLRMMKVTADYARTDFPVLITGESGTGKELVAREVHRRSNRDDKPFLVQNCSAIPDTLLESELFGYEKGAFTGAVKDKIGLFEAANGGTIFLDEIADMPLNLQARILRVIQNAEIKPLGGTRTKKVDVRVISATNKDLREAIAEKQFREDLYYRLNVLPIHLPPLRERQEDIPQLLSHFMKREALRIGNAPKRIAQDAMDYLMNYSWRGNIRELENFVRRIIVVVEGERITRADLSIHFPEQAHEGCSLEDADFPAENGNDHGHEHGQGQGQGQGQGHSRGEEAATSSAQFAEAAFEGHTWEQLEKAYVHHLLEKYRWHITRAAKAAGVNRSTFDSRMKKLGIRK